MWHLQLSPATSVLMASRPAVAFTSRASWAALHSFQHVLSAYCLSSAVSTRNRNKEKALALPIALEGPTGHCLSGHLTNAQNYGGVAKRMDELRSRPGSHVCILVGRFEDRSNPHVRTKQVKTSVTHQLSPNKLGRNFKM